jgi:hypothetical protein
MYDWNFAEYKKGKAADPGMELEDLSRKTVSNALWWTGVLLTLGSIGAGNLVEKRYEDSSGNEVYRLHTPTRAEGYVAYDPELGYVKVPEEDVTLVNDNWLANHEYLLTIGFFAGLGSILGSSYVDKNK